MRCCHFDDLVETAQGRSFDVGRFMANRNRATNILFDKQSLTNVNASLLDAGEVAFWALAAALEPERIRYKQPRPTTSFLKTPNDFASPDL